MSSGGFFHELFIECSIKKLCTPGVLRRILSFYVMHVPNDKCTREVHDWGLKVGKKNGVTVNIKRFGLKQAPIGCVIIFPVVCL